MSTKEEQEVSNEPEEFNEEKHNEEMIAKVQEVEDAVNPPKEDQEETESTSDETPEENSETQEDQEQTEDELEEAAEEAVEEAGLKMEDLEAEFAEQGQLSPESYLALERAGIPKSTVDNYIAGLEAQNRLIELEVYDQVGGKEEYQSLIKWADQNLSPDEIEAFDEAAQNPASPQFRLALDGLKAKYSSDSASYKDNLGGGNKPSADVFESVQQVTAAMSDPRYATDPAYQKQVADKLMRSNIM